MTPVLQIGRFALLNRDLPARSTAAPPKRVLDGVTPEVRHAP